MGNAPSSDQRPTTAPTTSAPTGPSQPPTEATRIETPATPATIPAKRSSSSWFKYDDAPSSPTGAAAAAATESNAAAPSPAAVPASSGLPSPTRSTQRSYTSWFRYDDQIRPPMPAAAAAHPALPAAASAAAPVQRTSATAVAPTGAPAPRAYSSWFRYDEPAATAATATSSPASPSAAPASWQALAPPPSTVALSSPRAPATLSSFAPVLGGVALLMTGSIAYGLRYGKKQAAKVEEAYAQYEVKPTEVEVEITPEMRRYALRRAMLAFGYGTALCMGTAGLISWCVSRQWDIYSFRDLGGRLSVVVGDIRLPFEDTANRIVDGFDAWMARTWIGQNWSSTGNDTDPASGSRLPPDLSAIAAQEAELAAMWSDAKRMQQEWNEGKVESMDRKKKN